MALARHGLVVFLANALLLSLAASVSRGGAREAEEGGSGRLVRSESSHGHTGKAGRKRAAANFQVSPATAAIRRVHPRVSKYPLPSYRGQQNRSGDSRDMTISDDATSLVEVAQGVAATSSTEKSGHFDRVEYNFLFGDNWPVGHRKDISAQIGYSFIAQVDFKITALARRLNEHGTVLAETTVTLWDYHKRVAAQVRIGPEDLKEDGFIWKELEEPIPVVEGQEYRITQECAKDMADPWFDGFLHDTKVHVHHETADLYAHIGHGVSSDDETGYPANDDGLGRRAGMLNFRVWVVPTYAQSRCCNVQPGKEDDPNAAMCNEGIEQPGWLTFDACMEKCRFAPKESPCIGVQFATMDCDTPQKCRCQLIPEGACGSYTSDVEFNYFTVFGPTHTVRLSQRHSGRVEVRHNDTWGTICKNGFTLNDALVVCRQLHLWNGAVLLPEDIPGEGGTGTIWMSEVMCEGGEPEVQDCVFGGWGTHSCTHAMDIGVNCTLPTPGPPGPVGPIGFRGINASSKATDWLGVEGPAGFRGLSGPPGLQGDSGINASNGEPGDLQPEVDVFFDKSWNMDALVTMPVFIIFFCFSAGITACLYSRAHADVIGDLRGLGINKNSGTEWLNKDYYGEYGSATPGKKKKKKAECLECTDSGFQGGILSEHAGGETMSG